MMMVLDKKKKKTKKMKLLGKFLLFYLFIFVTLCTCTFPTESRFSAGGIYDAFGTSVTGIGDLNGDFISDIAVGSPQANSGAPDAGVIYIILLNELGEIHHINQISKLSKGDYIDNDEETTIETGWNTKFGTSVTLLTYDYHHDNKVNLCVGSPNDDGTGSGLGTANGAIYLISINNDASLHRVNKITNLPYINSFDHFGYSIIEVDAIETVSYPSIAVGVPGDDDAGAGAIYILFMSIHFQVMDYQKISQLKGNFNVFNLPNLSVNDEFGYSLANLGDINQDGYTDLAIGVPYDDDGGTLITSDYGAIYIIFLNAEYQCKHVEKISKTYNVQHLNLNYLTAKDYFGKSLDSADINQDQIQDLIIGVPNDDLGGVNTGMVYIIYLNRQGTPLAAPIENFAADSVIKPVLDNPTIISAYTQGVYHHILKDDYFGRSVAVIGDINNDSILDFAIGAPGDDTYKSKQGMIYIIFNKFNTEQFIEPEATEPCPTEEPTSSQTLPPQAIETNSECDGIKKIGHVHDKKDIPCDCDHPLYFGLECNKESPCSSQPCQNGGTCITTATKVEDLCWCYNTGFYGHYCHIKNNAFNPKPISIYIAIIVIVLIQFFLG